MSDAKRSTLRRTPRIDLRREPITRALRAVEQRAPEIPDVNGYRAAHPRFRAFFAGQVAPLLIAGTIDEFSTAAAMGAALVYSWMPTILRGIRDDALNSSANTLARLPGLPSPEAFADLLEELDGQNDQLLDLLTFVNGSVVGTSKFLHFLNPSAVPIWDRRVASNFGVRDKSQIENLKRYRCYVRLVAEATAQSDYPEYLAFLGEPGPPAALDARSVEYALFINGDPDRE